MLRCNYCYYALEVLLNSVVALPLPHSFTIKALKTQEVNIFFTSVV